MDGYGAREERDAMTMDAMDRTPPITAGVTSLLRAPAATGTVLYTTTLTERRQVTVIVEGNPSATASIASLSSALVAAQASASLLAQQNQQLQIASASAVASAQAAAQLSASSLAASISSSAAVALASAAGAVANANNAASAAMQSANAALASASVIQAEAGVRSQQDGLQFSEAQLTIAIVISIVGTALVALAGVLCLLRYRNRREKRRLRELKAAIKRPNTASSNGSGDVVWEETFQQRPGRRRPPREPIRFNTPRRGPPRVPAPLLPETIAEERPPNWPRSAQSTLFRDSGRWEESPRPTSGRGPLLSLFPKVPEPDPRGMSLRSPRPYLREL